MRRIDIIRRAGRSLSQAKARTLLTSLAIAVGAFTLTLSLAVGEGSRQYVDTLIQSNTDPQALYVSKTDMMSGPPGASSGLREYDDGEAEFGGLSYETLTADDVAKLRANQNISSVVPTYLIDAEYLTVESSDTRYTSDVTVYDSTILVEPAAGTIPELGSQIGDDEVIVPEAYLETLGLSATELIDKTVTLRLLKQPNLSEDDVRELIAREGPAGLERAASGETRDVNLRVRAVSAESSTSFASSAGLYISENKAKELADFLTEGTDQFERYIAANAVVRDGVDPEVVRGQVEQLGLQAVTARDLQEALFTFVNILQGIVAGFGILALIASIFGIINTQYISVLERTRQIGLMKSLGASRRDIAKLFRYEAAWIGFLGGVLGAGLAFGLGAALNPWLTSVMNLGEGNRILLFVWWQIAALIGLLIIIAILAGFFPSRKAARLDPIEALRTE